MADRFPKGSAMELADLTGLTTAAASEAFVENYSDFGTALASIVQFKKSIPASYFSDAQVISKNARKINVWLRNMYELVGYVQEQTRCTPRDAWKKCAAAKWDRAAVLKAGSGGASGAVGGSKKANIYAQTPEGRYTGSYFALGKDFWDKEIVPGCTLTNRNEGFLEATGVEAVRERMLKWVRKASDMHGADLQFVPIPDPDEETIRVMIMDAQRTFNDDQHRKKFTEFIYSFSQELGSYGQPMAYLAAILLLALNENETARVLRMVGKEYIKGHWAAEARGFATNAWVTNYFTEKRCPAVAKHLMASNWFPHMYMQKILSGLCIHVLPWRVMFEFLDKFMERGLLYLMAFMLSLIEHFEPKLLACGPADVSTAFEILKLDPSVVEEHDVVAIFRKADGEMAQWLADYIKQHDVDLGLLRSEIYDDKLSKILNAAPKEAAFDPCEVCDKNKPKYWCETCEKYVCEQCCAASCNGHELEEA